jgi:hypothetical protein
LSDNEAALDLWAVTETACDALNNIAYRNADNQTALLTLSRREGPFSDALAA